MYQLIFALTIFLLSSNIFGEVNSMNKTIIVGEKLVKNNVWQNEFVREEYVRVAEHALQAHKKKYPNTKIEFIYSFDEDSIDGFNKAEKQGAFGVIGYKYSTQAIEASHLAQLSKIPYITAVSPVNKVRNEQSVCLAYSHNQLKNFFQKIRSKFDYPSIILLEDQHFTNLEYERIFKGIFNIKELFSGSSNEYLPKVKNFLKSTKDARINVLMAGYGLSQMDVVNSIFLEFGNRINFIAHTQWVFCEKILSNGLDINLENLYAVSDYCNPTSFEDKSISIRREVVTNNTIFNKYIYNLNSKMPIDEPVIYTMRDMMYLALEAAEGSNSRLDFLARSRNIEFNGFSDHYIIKDGNMQKRVYLAKWNKKGFKPIEVL